MKPFTKCCWGVAAFSWKWTWLLQVLSFLSVVLWWIGTESGKQEAEATCEFSLLEAKFLLIHSLGVFFKMRQVELQTWQSLGFGVFPTKASSLVPWDIILPPLVWKYVCQCKRFRGKWWLGNFLSPWNSHRFHESSSWIGHQEACTGWLSRRQRGLLSCSHL